MMYLSLIVWLCWELILTAVNFVSCENITPEFESHKSVFIEQLFCAHYHMVGLKKQTKKKTQKNHNNNNNNLYYQSGANKREKTPRLQN